MTNTQAQLSTAMRSFGLRPVPCGLSGFMLAGVYVSTVEAETMIARYRRAAARRASVTR